MGRGSVAAPRALHPRLRVEPARRVAAAQQIVAGKRHLLAEEVEVVREAEVAVEGRAGCGGGGRNSSPPTSCDRSDGAMAPLSDASRKLNSNPDSKLSLSCVAASTYWSRGTWGMPGSGIGRALSTPVNASSGRGGRYGGRSSLANGRGGGGAGRGAGAFCLRCLLASGWPRSDAADVAGFRRIVRMASGGLPTRSSCMYMHGASLPLPSTFLKPKLFNCL